MVLDVHHSKLPSIISEDAELQRIAAGFGFTEGPIWHPQAQYLIFSDIQESCQYCWNECDGLSLFRRPSNQANGNAFDQQGHIISCEHASSHLVRHEHDGKLVRVIASHFQGRALNSPNDVIVDSKGKIWFTDPSFGRIRSDLGIIREQALDFQGVYCLDPDSLELSCVCDDFQQPNGLCFSRDEQRLFVNDSWGGHVRVFAVATDGQLNGGEVWARIKGQGEGVPDGMKVDSADNLYCNGPGGVHVFDSDANFLGVIRTPEKSTNFCFGGVDLSMLYITASTSVYRIQTKTQGLPAFV